MNGYLKSPYTPIAKGLIGVLVGLYGIEYFILVQIPSVNAHYGVSIVLWSLVIGLVYGYLPRVHGRQKASIQSTLYWWSFNTGLTFILINGLAGFVWGVAKSPYNHQLDGILLNSLYVGTKLVGRECIRGYLIAVFCKEIKGWRSLGIIVLMTFTQINIGILLTVRDVGILFEWMIKMVLPTLTQNILAMYLVSYGGIGASLIVLGMGIGFEWLSPILPKFDSFIQSMLSVAQNLIATLLIKKGYESLTTPLTPKGETAEGLVKELPFIIGCILCIWFVMGVFTVYPKVIMTGSMKPQIQPGDVVIIQKIKNEQQLEDLEVGEIIAIAKGGKLIVHRIQSVIKEEYHLYYRTQGDANKVADAQLASPQQIKGKVVKVIPKIGLPSFWLRTQLVR